MSMCEVSHWFSFKDCQFSLQDERYDGTPWRSDPWCPEGSQELQAPGRPVSGKGRPQGLSVRWCRSERSVVSARHT